MSWPEGGFKQKVPTLFLETKDSGPPAGECNNYLRQVAQSAPQVISSRYSVDRVDPGGLQAMSHPYRPGQTTLCVLLPPPFPLLFFLKE